MKKLVCILLLLCLLAGCGADKGVPAEDPVDIVCTTYPMYLLTKQVVGDMPDVLVRLLIDQDISCVHDYALSVTDMKKLDSCDFVVINGAGFEVFLDDVDLSGKSVIDASAGIPLLGEDPHIWLDPERAAGMVINIAESLSPTLDGETLMANAESYYDTLLAFKAEQQAKLESLTCNKLITFHDGFAYFADAFDLEVLKSIEEESGSEASAAEISQIIDLIESNSIPAVFTEVNGSDATALAISREMGVNVATLNMMISRPDNEVGDVYCELISANIDSVIEAMK